MNIKKIVMGLLGVLTFFSYSQALIIPTQTIQELMACLPSPLPDSFEILNVTQTGTYLYVYEYHYEDCGTMAPAYYTTVRESGVQDWKNTLQDAQVSCVIVIGDANLFPSVIDGVRQLDAGHQLLPTVQYFIAQNCTMGEIRETLIPVRDVRHEIVVFRPHDEDVSSFPESSESRVGFYD